MTADGDIRDQDPGQPSSETRRKAVHVSCLLFALPFAWLPWKGALFCTFGALLFNFAILPRLGGAALLREGERSRGHSVGILFYPFSLVLLVLAFRERLEFVAAAWALMALGDGMASLVGSRSGTHSLPWNPRKSWEGVAAHFVFGGVGAATLMYWVAGGPQGLDLSWAGLSLQPQYLVAGFGAALFTAWLESLETGVDDNLVVPLAGGGVSFLIVTALAQWGAREADLLGPRFLMSLALCLGLAVVAYWVKSLSLSGAVSAGLLGTLIVTLGGWGSFLVLCSFFALGTACTKLGRRIKEERGIAEDRGGRRAVGNVLANGGLAGLCVLVMNPDAPQWVGVSGLAGLVLVGGLATAAFDTVSSEIGKAWGRNTFLATTGEPVAPGTEGALSLEGTAAGMLAALFVGVVGWLGGVLPTESTLGAILAVTVGAFIGTCFESFVGAWAQARNIALENDFENFTNTVVGGLAALFLWLM